MLAGTWCSPWFVGFISFNPVFPLFVFVSGVSGVRADRLAEAMTAKHCALSLVGEPIMYPEINRFVKLLHQHGISSFLVTNAQFPDEIR